MHVANIIETILFLLQDYEFVAYTSEKANSYVRDGILYVAPTLVSEIRGEDFVTQGKLELPGYVSGVLHLTVVL